MSVWARVGCGSQTWRVKGGKGGVDGATAWGWVDGPHYRRCDTE